MVEVGEDKWGLSWDWIGLNGFVFVYIGLLMINEIIYLIWLEIMILTFRYKLEIFFNTFWMK